MKPKSKVDELKTQNGSTHGQNFLQIFKFEKIMDPNLSTKDTQIHRSVLLDHKMIIEGIQYHEKKELEKLINEVFRWSGDLYFVSYEVHRRPNLQGQPKTC